MTKKDRTNLSILIVLLVVLGLTIVLGYRMNQPPTTNAVQTVEAKPATTAPTATDARIRLELVEKAAEEEDIGRKNLFQYRQAPPPPPSNVKPPTVTATPPSQAAVAAPPTVANRPPQPPQPPPIPLKYQGFAAVKSPQTGMTAFLADDSRHFNVTVGEVLMGRYRIAGITDKSVEIEDLEFNRRQILPLVK
jgi:hypothetical protein